MISCDQFGAVGVDADGFSVVHQGHSGLVAYECAMSCECSVPGVREPQEVAGGAPVSAAVSRAGGVALLLARQCAVTWILDASWVSMSVGRPEHLAVSLACSLDDESVMRQECEPVGITQTEGVVRVSLGRVELVAGVRR